MGAIRKGGMENKKRWSARGGGGKGGGEDTRRFHTNYGSWRELNPILRVLGCDELVPRTHCVVQTGDIFIRHASKGAPVVVVPSNGTQITGCVVLQWRVGSAVKDTRFARGMGGYWDGGKEAVRVRIEVTEDRCDVEAVDEEGCTACPIGVFE